LGCVLVVPFHPLKRGLHDLLAGTIVIRGGMLAPVFLAARTNRRNDRRIVVGAAVLAVMVIGAGVVVSQRLASLRELNSLLAIADELRESGVANVGISRNIVRSNGGPPVVTVMGSGFLPRPAGGGEPDWAMAEVTFAEAVKRGLPAEVGVDRIGSALRTGFNIGIYKSYETRTLIEDARTGQVLETSTTSNW
jgi:hypothetical protein